MSSYFCLFSRIKDLLPSYYKIWYHQRMGKKALAGIEDEVMEPEAEETPNLPAVPLFQMPIQAKVTLENFQQELDKEDLAVANAQLRMCGVFMGQVRTIPELTSMIRNTIDATKHRRAVLKEQYGYIPKGSKHTWEPLD